MCFFTVVFMLFTYVQCLAGCEIPTDNQHCETGTLIVSYSLESNPERLSRVRFLLTSHIKETMYPKGSAYVENLEDISRLVAVENLPIGKYVIKFLIPNSDDIFEEIPNRTIAVSKNSVLRIDQNIRLKNPSSDQ